jgi:hypothetical protein
MRVAVCRGVGCVAFPKPSSQSRFRRTFSESLHDPTPLHRSSVTPASQELVQPPIHLSKPASDAALNNFGLEDRRICGAPNRINRWNIIALTQTKEDPPMLAKRVPSPPAKNCWQGNIRAPLSPGCTKFGHWIVFSSRALAGRSLQIYWSRSRYIVVPQT